MLLVAACGRSEATPTPPATSDQPTASTLSAKKTALAIDHDDQRWKGRGALFTLDGKKIADYRLEMRRKKLSSSRFRTAAKVHLRDGTVKEMTCTMDQADQRWRSACGERKGGGYCLGDGLCLDYVADDADHAFATTIIIDGDDQMRMFRTELDGGKAVRFFREKLSLVR
jgi:hypothetical protein